MNVLRKYALLFQIIQRIFDVGILLFITWMMAKKGSSPELMYILGIYGSLLMAVIFSLFKIYRSWRRVTVFEQLQGLLFAWVCVLVVFSIIILLMSNKGQLPILWPIRFFPWQEFLLWSLLVFLGLGAIRVAVKLLLTLFRKKGFNQRHAVIVGTGEAGRKMAQYLDENKRMGINLIGFFDDSLAKGEVVKTSPSVLGTVLGSIDECPEFSLTRQIDMAFIALPMRAEGKINELVWGLGTKGVTVLLVPDLFTFGIQKAKVHQMGELHLIDFNVFPGWKRTFDIIFSIMLIMLTSPLWVMIMVLIKMEDGGPIFYKHPRIMETGKRFDCLKFRTMHINADQRLNPLLEQDPALREEWERTYKLKNDPRVTKVGRFLRKTSLDELPQFLNVLAGQMSVVGARPIVPEELEKYYKDIALTYCSMKPGITGPWQAGNRSDTEDYDERVKLDRSYVLNNSMWFDIKIILKTFWSVLKTKGAY
jgi:exopolysaccharide biosynthesis polyprenyl glycosylphosphotransferase